MLDSNIAWVNCKFINDRMDSTLYITQISMGLFELFKKEDNIYFKIKTLEDICEKIVDGPFGSAILEDDYVNEGIPFIRVQNVTENGLNNENLVFISKEANEKIKRSECKPGDLVMTKTGRLGTTCVLTNEYSIYNIRGDLAKLELKKYINPYYVISYLNSNFGTKIINSYSSGSTRGRILLSNIKKVPIPIPSPEIQKYIGDKVRRAEELREEARRLKKEAEELVNNYLGFIQTDDTKKYSSVFISSSKVSDRIDSEYYHIKYLNIESELNKKGYKLIRLEDLCSKIINGKTYPTSSKRTKYYNIGVGELGNWFINKNNDKFIQDSVNKKYVLRKNSIIWGNAAHLAKYIGEKVNIVLESDTVVPTTEITAIEPDEDKINPYYLFLFMNSQWGYYQIQRTVKGMTAHSYPHDISKILVPMINFNREEERILKEAVEKSYNNEVLSKQLIQQAKQDVEDLIEGKFDMSKLRKSAVESG